MKTTPAGLGISILLILSTAGCDASHGNRTALVPLDCGHRDQVICAMVVSIGKRLPELTNREQPLPHSERVALDVAAILAGMQRPNVNIQR
jgi:hypothetical protein